MGRLDLPDPIRDEDIYPATEGSAMSYAGDYPRGSDGENRETRMPSTFDGPAVPPTEGQIDLNGDVLRRPTAIEARYWPPCCDKALVLPPACVCAYTTTCPDHGTRHNGTHD